MLSDEEKEKLEQEFQYALDNIVSKIKGETATAIVVSEQSMILLFKKLMLKIEKQSKEIEEYKKQLDLDYVKNNYTSNDKIKAKIEELDKHITDIRNIARKSTDKVECRLLNDDINEYFKAKSVLQSLLEKE